MEEIKLYHATPIANLTELDPNLSRVGNLVVSATRYKEYALLYATANNRKGLDGAYGVSNGVPYFIEFYKGAIESRFKSLEGYLYEVDPTNFDKNKSTMKAETRSFKPVKVLKCTKIDDVYEELLKAEKEGKIKFVRYNNNKDFQSFIDWNIKFNISWIAKTKEHPLYEFCMEKFPKQMKELQAENEYFKDIL